MVAGLANGVRTGASMGARDGIQVEMILFAGDVDCVISVSASLLVSDLKKRTV